MPRIWKRRQQFRQGAAVVTGRRQFVSRVGNLERSMRLLNDNHNQTHSPEIMLLMQVQIHVCEGGGGLYA